jgi:hypothetical protein
MDHVPDPLHHPIQRRKARQLTRMTAEVVDSYIDEISRIGHDLRCVNDGMYSHAAGLAAVARLQAEVVADGAVMAPQRARLVRRWYQMPRQAQADTQVIHNGRRDLRQRWEIPQILGACQQQHDGKKVGIAPHQCLPKGDLVFGRGEVFCQFARVRGVPETRVGRSLY